MNDKLLEYEYLWCRSNERWVLVDSKLHSQVDDMIIVDMSTKSALIIEDNSLAILVMKQMIDAGIKIKSVGEVF
jgi:hypothetical protein